MKAKAALEEEGVEFYAMELDEMGKPGYAIRAELGEVRKMVLNPEEIFPAKIKYKVLKFCETWLVCVLHSSN